MAPVIAATLTILITVGGAFAWTVTTYNNLNYRMEQDDKEIEDLKSRISALEKGDDVGVPAKAGYSIAPAVGDAYPAEAAGGVYPNSGYKKGMGIGPAPAPPAVSTEASGPYPVGKLHKFPAETEKKSIKGYPLPEQ